MATVLPPIVERTPAVSIAPTTSPPIPTPLEQRVVLYNVSWETYERLVEEIENPGTRLTYDEGVLEIVSPRETHDRFKELMGCLLDVLTEELDMPRRSTGQTTWKKKAKKKGVEADKSYYLTSAPKVRGKREVDQAKDPPPDLAIEVENTTSALDRLAIYATLGVAEVWRYDGEELTIHALQPDGQYAEQATTQFFPQAAIAKMVEWIAKCDEMDETAWVKEFRRWVRENLVQAR
jgi:Uma2 family endonuclease